MYKMLERGNHMGEKVYKPVVKDGDHILRSKDNPDRVRGLTRDENNKNPDIIEWQEFDLDDLKTSDWNDDSYEDCIDFIRVENWK